MSIDVILNRLDDQIGWYDRKSGTNQRCYKFFKYPVIVVAAMIPVLSSIPNLPPWTLGALGATITIIEGIQQLNQYQSTWYAYQETCEALKHEKYLYLGNAGPYSNAANADVLLAERVEMLLARASGKDEKREPRATALDIGTAGRAKVDA